MPPVSLGIACQRCEQPLSAQLGSRPGLWLMAARCQSQGTLVRCDACQHRFVAQLGQTPAETPAETPATPSQPWQHNAPHIPLPADQAARPTENPPSHTGPHWHRAPQSVEDDSQLWRR